MQRTVQSSEGPIPILTRRERGGVAAGLRSQGGGGKELFGPGEVLLLLEGKHRRDKPRGSLAVRVNSGCTTSTVSTRQGFRLSVTFLPLASSAENEELLLGAPEKTLKATILPPQPQYRGLEVQRTVGASSAPLPGAQSRRCRGPWLASTARWPRSCTGEHWRGCGARCWAVTNVSSGCSPSVAAAEGVRRVHREWVQRCHPRRQPHQRRLWAHRGAP